LLVILVVVLSPRPSTAGEVTGEVKLDGVVVQPGTTLELRRAGDVRKIRLLVGKDGSYRVFLEPGRYSARLEGARGELTVRSFPAAVRQDLQFQR
jgi:hypothetical protein